MFTNLEYGSNFDGLFEEGSSKVNFLVDITTVDLDFNDLSLLDFEWGKLWLSVGKESDDAAFLLQLSDLFVKELSVLLHGSFVFSESSDLVSGLLVESTFAGISNVSGPDGVGLSDTTWGLDVTDDTSTDHWWGI